MVESGRNAADPTPLLVRDGSSFVENDDDLPPILLSKKDDEGKVPPSTHFINDVKLKFWQFRYPLKVLGIDCLCLILVQALLAGRDLFHYHNYYTTSGYQDLQYQTMLRTGLLISLVMLLWNANLCLKAAKSVEEKLKAGNTSEVSEGSKPPDEAPEFDYAQFSRHVDVTFNSTSDGTARSSFLVCLLYALCSVAVWQSVENGTGILQVHFMETDDIPEKGQCFENSFFSHSQYFYDEEEERGIGSLKHDPNFKSLPLDVRTWISQQREYGREMLELGGDEKKGGFNQSVPFLQLKGGDFVFAKSRNNPHTSSRNADANKVGIAVFNPSTSAVTEYQSTCKSNHDFYDGEIELVGFPAEPPYSAWCSIFKISSSMVLQDEVLCYNEHSEMLHRFDCVKDTGTRWNGWGGDQYSLHTTPDNQLWIASSKHFRKGNKKSTNMVLLKRYNIEAMESTLVLAWNTTDTRNQGRAMRALNPSCSGYYWTMFYVSLSTLTFLSYYLYRLDVASCTVPVALALSLVAKAFLHPAAAGVSLLVVACICLCLLVAVKRSSVIWKYISISMLIRALYAFQVTSSWVFWSPSFSDEDFYEAEVFFSFLPFPLLSCVVAAATNVLLNHPFFQVLAVCFGSLSIFSFLFALMGLNFLMIPLLLAALSLGCFRAGTLLQMYRVHLIVHARRLCQQLPSLPSAAAR